MEENICNPDNIAEAKESENGYSPNRRLPRFVGPTEIRRLNKVVEEKNALIEKFRKYDEERKAYYADFMEEYEAMKDSFDQFTQELQKVFEDNGREVSDYRKVLRLYRNWLNYKNHAEHYKDKLAGARESVRDIKDDLRKLEELLGQLEYETTTNLEHVVSRMFTMRKHLDTLQSKLLVQ
jgi:chromosome segregation ATPase